MAKIKSSVIFSAILFMVATVPFAQSQIPNSGQIKGNNHRQEQIKTANPNAEDAEQKSTATPTVTESGKVVVKSDGQGSTPKKKNIVIDRILTFLRLIKIGVDGKSDLPAVLLGVVVAYLTIIVSVAIAIFSEKREFEALDRNVILDHIMKAKRLLLYLGFTFIPLLFWNSSSAWFRLLEIGIWLIGIAFITKILSGCYNWMKGNKFSLRFDYLRELRNKQDMEEAWRSVWQTENINFSNEQEFFVIFNSTIDRLLENDER